MNANFMASSLLASHALPNQTSHVAHSETQAPAGDFDGLLAGLDQRSGANPAEPGETAAASANQRAATSKADTSPSPMAAKLATNVDALLSSLGTAAPFAQSPAATVASEAQSIVATGASSTAATMAPSKATNGALSKAPRLATSATPTVSPLTASIGAPSTAPVARAGTVTVKASPRSGSSETKQNPVAASPISPIASAPTEERTLIASTPQRSPIAQDNSSPSPPMVKLAANVDGFLTSLATTGLVAPKPPPIVGPPVSSTSGAIPIVDASTIKSLGASVAAPTKGAPIAPTAPASANVNVADLDKLLSPESSRPSSKTSDLASQTPAPGAAMGTISFATKAALVFAPELSFQSLQTKTHLAVSGAKSAVSAPSGKQTSLDAAAVPLATGVAARGEAHSRDEPLPQRNSGAEARAAEPSKVAVVSAPEATAAIAAPAAASSTDTEARVVNLSDLADHLVNEAQTLTTPNAATNTPLGAAPIKQLQLNLEPAHLGAVAVTLKLSNGKLSVDVGVANAKTLAEVEGQRETIVSKLQSAAQPLESFVVHQQAFGEANRSQALSDPSPSGSLENASANDTSSQDSRDQAPRQPRTPPTPTGAAPRLGPSVDLVV